MIYFLRGRAGMRKLRWGRELFGKFAWHSESALSCRLAGKKKTLSAGVAVVLGAMSAPAHAQYVGRLSSFVADTQSGAVLSQVDADLPRYPASLTKLMTLYITFKALQSGQISLHQAVPVSAHASAQAPSKLGLRPGSTLTVEEAVLGLVTKSANDAACALGEFLAGGSEPAFGQMMTAQAHRLGMTRTTFRNASGLPDPEQVTTARDLAILAQHIIVEFPVQYHYFSEPYFIFRGRSIPNHNPMLGFYPGADGMKTGFTNAAGLNLVTSAERDHVRLVGVVLGASSKYERTRTMSHALDAAFAAEGVAFAPYKVPHVVMASSAGTVHQTVMAGARRHRYVDHGHHAVLVAGRNSHSLEVAQAVSPRAKVHKASATLSKKTSHPAHSLSLKAKHHRT